MAGADQYDRPMPAPLFGTDREAISSTANPKVKQLVKLRKRRDRDEAGVFIIEGYRELSRALAAGIDVVEVYSCEALFLGLNEPSLVDDLISTGAEHVRLEEAPFVKAAYRDRPEGLLAVATQFETSLARLGLPPDPLVLVVEAIEKPGNLGTMMRTADAGGVDAVVVADPTTDPFNPNVVRASIGSLFTVPLAVATTDETQTWLGVSGARTVATTPYAETLHWEADYTGAVAIVIGSEQHGLSESWLNGADQSVRIPMAGTADSLNAAIATGITLFEAIRQRSTEY